MTFEGGSFVVHTYKVKKSVILSPSSFIERFVKPINVYLTKFHLQNTGYSY